jgi:ABC-type antimicrobial peptide transport system permease subunit
MIRAAGQPAALADTIRREIAAVDRNLEISAISTVTESRERELSRERLLASLSGFFGLLALALAAIGLYGLMAYAVVRRTQEIGIRMALGAQQREVVWLMIYRTVALVAVGVAIGIPTSLAASRLIANQLFGISPNDPWPLGAAICVVVATAGLAGLLPARRASRVDPMVALRYE